MRCSLRVGVLLLAAMCWGACGGSSICESAERRFCFAVGSEVPTRCAWGDFEVTVPNGSDDFCMARNELLNELCDAGVDEDIEVVESEMVCDVVVEDI